MDPIIQIVTIVLSAVTLIVYFFMALNISRIKTGIIDINAFLKSPVAARNHTIERARTNFYLNKSLGRNEAAIENIYTIIFTKLGNLSLSKEERVKMYDNLRKQYEKHLIAVGGTFPDYPFDQND